MFNKIIIFFLLIISTSQPFKILVCNPKFAHSHVNFFGQIADILHDAGHNVTVLSVEMDLSIKHPGAYKAKIINYPPNPVVVEIFSQSTSDNLLWKSGNDVVNQLNGLNKWTDGMYNQGLMILNDKNLTSIMINERFDFAITEAFGYYFVGIFKIWGIKNYGLGLSTNLLDCLYNDFGLHFPSSYIPTSMNYFNDKITFTDRLYNLITHWITAIYKIWKWNKTTLYSEINQKYGKNFYNIKNSLSSASYFFINSNPLLDFPGPKVPKMIEIGGVGLSKPKKLNKFWDNILSKNNYTIVISFGSILKCHQLPKQMKRGIIDTIKKMKNITFIWKYDKPDDGTNDGIDNLILVKWIPQNDLLNDKRISLFITHCGFNSITELSFSGVKALAIPIFADQFKNSLIIKKHGIGKIMNKNDLEIDGLLEVYINDIINNIEYTKNALLLSERLNNQPISPKELLIKHVEFACKYGPLSILDLSSINMGFIEYHNIDVLTTIFGFFLILILIFTTLIRYLCLSKIDIIKKNQ